MSVGATLASTISASARRHDQHDASRRADHAADGMHGQLMHGAGLRRADVDAPELVHARRFTRSCSSAIFGLALSRRSFSTSVRKSWSSWMIWSSISLILPRARAISAHELAVLAFELGLVALQRHVAHDADQVLLVELRDALELLADEA